MKGHEDKQTCISFFLGEMTFFIPDRITFLSHRLLIIRQMRPPSSAVHFTSALMVLYAASVFCVLLSDMKSSNGLTIHLQKHNRDQNNGNSLPTENIPSSHGPRVGGLDPKMELLNLNSREDDEWNKLSAILSISVPEHKNMSTPTPTPESPSIKRNPNMSSKLDRMLKLGGDQTRWPSGHFLNDTDSCSYWVLIHFAKNTPFVMVNPSEVQSLTPTCTLAYVVHVSHNEGIKKYQTQENTNLPAVDRRVILMYTTFEDKGYTWMPMMSFYEIQYSVIVDEAVVHLPNVFDRIRKSMEMLMSDKGLVVMENSSRNGTQSKFSFVASETAVMRRLTTLNHYRIVEDYPVFSWLYCYCIHTHRTIVNSVGVRVESNEMSNRVCAKRMFTNGIDNDQCTPNNITSKYENTTGIVIALFKRNYVSQQMKVTRTVNYPTKVILLYQTGLFIDLASTLAGCGVCRHIHVTNHDFLYHFRYIFDYALPQEVLLNLSDDNIMSPVLLDRMGNMLKTHDRILGNRYRVLTSSYLTSNSHSTFAQAFLNNKNSHSDLLIGAWIYRSAAVRAHYSMRRYALKNGEDIHFSFTNRMLCGRETWSLHHPDPTIDLGRDQFSSYKKPGHHEIRADIVCEFILNGYIPVGGTSVIKGDHHLIGSSDSQKF